MASSISCDAPPQSASEPVLSSHRWVAFRGDDMKTRSIFALSICIGLAACAAKEPTAVHAPEDRAPAPEEAPVPVPEPEPAAEPETKPEPSEPEPTEPEPAADPNAVAGANLTVGSLTADGLTLENLSCRADGLGFLGSVVIAGSLSKKKGALSACAKGQSPRVRWSFTGDKVTTVSVEGVDDKSAACVKKALMGATAPGEGECAATLAL
jgi:hypothetical protein